MERDLLLEKFLNNTLSPEEQREFEAREDYSFVKMLIEDAAAFKAPDVNQIPEYSQLQERLEGTKQVKTISGVIKPLIKYAAVAAVLVLGYFLVFNNQATTFTTQLAQTQEVVLPDASQVTLNALSQISYKEKDWSSNREIELEGEAFFDVTKGSTFDVITDLGKVTVLGTEFTVKQRGDYFEVLCYEGKVAVIANKERIELLPGELFRFIKGQSEQLSFNANAPSWMKGRSSFNKVPLKEVIAELERQYDIKVLSNGIDLEQKFHGVFVHKQLDSALQQITLPLSLTYVINKDQTVIITKREAN